MQGSTYLACKQKFMGHSSSSLMRTCTYGLYKLEIWVSKINYKYTLTTLCPRQSKHAPRSKTSHFICYHWESLEASHLALTWLSHTACCCEYGHLQELSRHDSTPCLGASATGELDAGAAVFVLNGFVAIASGLLAPSFPGSMKGLVPSESSECLPFV
jgi:hypothetical protein